MVLLEIASVHLSSPTNVIWHPWSACLLRYPSVVPLCSSVDCSSFRGIKMSDRADVDDMEGISGEQREDREGVTWV